MIAHPPAIRAAGECPGTATLVFGDDAAYSGPGPFNAFLLVKNEGVADVRDVVVAFSVGEGGQYFHEAVFGNGQLWWAHGAADAGIIHVVPEIAAGDEAGVRMVVVMRPEWSANGRLVVRATIVGATCAVPPSDEALLTFTAPGETTAVTATVEPSRTPTPVRSATPVSTVLGIEEEPTGAPPPPETPPVGQVLPEGGDGDGSDGSAAFVVLAFVAIALGFLAVGVVAGRLLPR